MKQVIKIDIVSDVICPWCYIGKRRLDKAIEALERQLELWGIDPSALGPLSEDYPVF